MTETLKKIKLEMVMDPMEALPRNPVDLDPWKILLTCVLGEHNQIQKQEVVLAIQSIQMQWLDMSLKVKHLETEILLLKTQTSSFQVPIQTQSQVPIQSSTIPIMIPVNPNVPQATSAKKKVTSTQNLNRNSKVAPQVLSPTDSPWIQVVKKKNSKNWAQIAKENLVNTTQKISQASVQVQDTEKASLILKEMLRLPKHRPSNSKENSDSSNKTSNLNQDHEIPPLDSLTYLKVDLPLQLKFLSSLKVAAESTTYVLKELTKCQIFQASALHAGRTEILIKKSDVPIFSTKIADLPGARIVPQAPIQTTLPANLHYKDIERKAYLFVKEKNLTLRQAILMDLPIEDQTEILNRATRLTQKLNLHPVINTIIHKNIHREQDRIKQSKRNNLNRMPMDLEDSVLVDPSESDLEDLPSTDPLEDPNY